MLTLILKNLSPEGEKQLKKDLKQLEETTNQPCEYHIKEALIRYIEDMEDIRDVEEYIEEKKKGKVKYYTSEEVKERLEKLKK